MNYDIDMCDGITYDNQICPLSQNCRRFMEVLDKGFAWFLDYASYESGPNEGGCWDSYEECLNDAIFVALKLI